MLPLLGRGWDTSPGCGHATDPPRAERQRREERPSIHLTSRSNPLAAPLHALYFSIKGWFRNIQKTPKKIYEDIIQSFSWINQWETRAPGRLQYLLHCPVSTGRSDGRWWSQTTCASWSQMSPRFSLFCPRGTPQEQRIAKLPVDEG